jgi:starch phosphorylase
MNNVKIAYFSAEVGIDERIKTYSGGLGILAGDTIKAMADLEVPFCAVTLLYNKGFFKQRIENHYQKELDDEWPYHEILTDTKKLVKVNISGQDVIIKIWMFEYEGVKGHKIPIYFLDANLEENPQWARSLTEHLYRGDRISHPILSPNLL